jgi:hypothetical protein
MQTGMLHLHNLLRWVVILFMLLTLIKSFSGMSNKKPFTGGDKKTALFLLISVDLQLLVGLYLYFTSAWGLKNIQNAGMGAVMKDTVGRFWAVEHIFGMLVAIALVHIGYSAVKKNIDDTAKFKKLFWFTLIAAIIVFATIPWPFRAGVGRAIFPGM